MSEVAGLAVWVVYDHPKDFPGFFVARKQVAHARQVEITDDSFMHESLAVIQHTLEHMGLVRIPRDPDDDPVIVESWI